MNSITSTSPFRFDIFEPSGFSSSGRWANRGGVTPSDAYKSRCRGREGNHSCFMLTDRSYQQRGKTNLPSNDMGDTHLVVIYDRSEMIRWEEIRL